MVLDVTYTFEDYAEANAAHMAASIPRRGAYQGLFGWGLFVALVALFFMMLRQRSPARPILPPVVRTPATMLAPRPAAPVRLAPIPLLAIFLPVLPWLLIFGFIWFFVFRQLRAQQKSPQSSLFAPGSGRPDPTRPPAAGGALRRRLMTWVTAGGLVLGALFVMVAQNALTEDEAPPMLLHPLMRIVPWVMFASALILMLRGGQVGVRRVWEGQSHLQRPKRIEVTDEGVTISDALSRMEHRWPSFTHVRETPNIFLLYVSNYGFHMVPKRGFASAAEADEFRELVRRTVVERPGPAFPVLPVAAVPPPDITPPSGEVPVQTGPGASDVNQA